MIASALVICIGTGFTTSGAATNSLSTVTAPETLRHLSERGTVTSVSRATGLPTSADVKTEGHVSVAVTRSERCPTARQGLRFYSRRYNEWRSKMGAGDKGAEPRGSWTFNSSSPCPRYLANLYRQKSRNARKAYKRWHAELQRKLLDAQFAICFVFGAYCSEALRVFECESGLSRHAHNGQYLGIAQMGDYARSRYGHSDTFLGQARAAYRYFAASGYDWSPWSCKPQ